MDMEEPERLINVEGVGRSVVNGGCGLKDQD
jgi:hypothetical protein